MRRLLAGLALLAATGAEPRAAAIYVAPDVPTTETVGATTLLPSSVTRYDIGVYSTAFPVPGNPEIDAIHKLDAAGSWLFSVEGASDLGGALPSPAQGRDVVRYDGLSGTYALFFCGGSAPDAVPDGTNVDAVLLDGGDGGDLWVSFDVPTTIGPFTFDPGDLVAYGRTGAGCAEWALLPGNPAFDASAAGIGFPVSSNVVGAAKIGGKLLVTVDVPTDVGPPGVVTHETPQVLSWDGATWSTWETLLGWPSSSVASGLSTIGNPGSVELLTVAKSISIPGNLDLSWSAGCSAGGTDYGIYEGTIGSWYSHVAIACTDAGGDRTESIAPSPGNRYYLVVPRNDFAEGSYGVASGGVERPAGGGACTATKVVSSCP